MLTINPTGEGDQLPNNFFAAVLETERDRFNECGERDGVGGGEVVEGLAGFRGQPDVQIPAFPHDVYSYPAPLERPASATLWLQQVASRANMDVREEADASRGTPRPPAGCAAEEGVPMSGDQALRAFMTYMRRRNLSASTALSRRLRLRSFADWLDVDLLAATPAHIEKWLDHHDLAPQTRYTYIAQLAAFYRWALRERMIRKDPTEQIIRPKLPRRVPRPIGRDDLAHGIASADPRMRCWLLLAAFAGARCMEIAALRVEDIHRDQNVLLLHGKGNKERLVPLHEDVLRALIAFGLPRAGFVFRRRDGKPLLPSTVSRYVGTYLRSVGIDATCHQGRHAYATALYQLSGGDLRLVQDLLGHSSPTSTAIYAAWAPARAAEVVDQLKLAT